MHITEDISVSYSIKEFIEIKFYFCLKGYQPQKQNYPYKQ